MTSTGRAFVTTGVSTLALACAYAAGASAQTIRDVNVPPQAVSTAENQSGKIEEVIVTAQRRSQKIQKTPISMSAYTTTSLATMNATSLPDIGAATANTQFNQNGGESIVFIRGIGQSDAIVTADPGVAIYIDGVYIPRLFGDTADLLDVERVEVLRGPQGTLFGKNTIGGAISLTTKTPTLTTTSGKIEARLGSRQRADLGGYVTFPIIRDVLGASIAFSSRSQEGNVYLPNLNTYGGNTRRQSARGQLYWKPSDSLSFTLAGEYYHQRETGVPTQLVNADPNGYLVSLWNTFVAPSYGSSYGTAGLASRNTSYGTGDYYDNVDVRGVSLSSSWNIGPGTLKSITASRLIGRQANGDVDAEPQPITNNPVDESSRALSEEIQYSGNAVGDKLHYVGGLFYLWEHAKDSQSVHATTGLYDALIAAGNTELAVATDSTQDSKRDQVTKSYATYGEVSYELTPALNASVGARYSSEQKTTHLYLYYPSQERVGVDKIVSQSFSSFTPKVGLTYQINANDMLYVTVSNGFKSGGINGRPTVSATVQPYRPETVQNYEVGVKTQWLDNRLRLNLSAYHMDYKDIQLQVAGYSSAGALLLTIENPGDAVMNGLEGELKFKPVPFITLGVNIGLNDAHYTHLAEDAPVTTHDRLTYNPKWSGNLSAEFDIPLHKAGDLVISVNHNFRSKYYLDTANTESIAQKAYGVTGGRITYHAPNKRLAFYLYGTNLANTYYKQFAIPEASVYGWDAATYAPPRELGAGITLDF